ncbi:ATP-binding protein [Flavobacterium olei]|uniref:ATP-binding protein n=1 Tax=Flavobacterium olei TaxID=1886782 RepID=UPI003D27A563
MQFTDNGIGIRPEDAPKIFNIFQKLHGSSEFAGTGIGLAMCKKIVQNHNDDINADESTENGAVFNVYLPKL